MQTIGQLMVTTQPDVTWSVRRCLSVDTVDDALYGVWHCTAVPSALDADMCMHTLTHTACSEYHTAGFLGFWVQMPCFALMRTQLPAAHLSLAELHDREQP